MTRVVLLDRDGTINVDRPNYVTTREELILEPCAIPAIARLTRSGYRILVVTNQACVGKGIVSRERLDAIHAEIDRQVVAGGGRIDGWYVCPHRDEDRCACRKPLPGLISQARREWNFRPAQTWCVGDAGRDIEMARSAGCRPALVLTGKGRDTARSYPEVATFPDLDAWARAVLDTPDVES